MPEYTPEEPGLIGAQRAWARKKLGDEIADTLRVEHDGKRWVYSSVCDGTGKVDSHYMHVWRDGKVREYARHELRAGEVAGPGESWTYPDWMPLPAEPKLVAPGAVVLCGGAHRHNGHRAEVLASRVKVAGPVPRNYRKYHLRCVDESCDWPRKEFRMELGGMMRGARLIELPVTIEAINEQRNTELRRTMIGIYGLAEYLRGSDAHLRSQDDWGKLWVLPQRNDEDLVLVEMVSPTPPHPVYFERVPPETRTALAGLAWQADMTELEYASMDVET